METYPPSARSTAIYTARELRGHRTARVSLAWPRRLPLPGRRTRWLLLALAVLLAAPVAILVLPVPTVDAYLTRLVTQRIAAQVACPGVAGPAPQISLKGGRLLPQLLHRRLSEIQM